MTNKDVILQIFSEASGMPLKDIENFTEYDLPMLKDTGKMGDELSDEDAAKLLARFRSQIPGIQRWLAEGNLLAKADMAKRQGPVN